MSIVVKIVSIVLKSVVDNKISDELAKDLIGVSIDDASEAGINKIKEFIGEERTKIDYILSWDNMKSLDIPEKNINYIVAEIKDLLSGINISDELLRQCKYDSFQLMDFMLKEYVTYKNGYIECENDIKKSLLAVAETLNGLVRESEEFSEEMMIQISNSVDDVNVGLQKIYEYMKENFDNLDNNSQRVFNILLMILEQIQKLDVQGNETKSITDGKKKFQNDKKQKYIENWNNRLFLHIDNEENPLTLADVFIIPYYKMHKSISGIEVSNDDTLDKIIERFVKYDRMSTMLITGAPGIGKTSIISWIANKYRDNGDVIILRFRDWSDKDLLQGLLNAISYTLNYEIKNLENKVIVLDGFDEIKLVNKRKNLIREFFNNILDFENLKVIITSRPDYLEVYDFQNILEILPLDIFQIGQFYQIIKGAELDQRKIDCDYLDVLGIPVILYMAIMADMDLSSKTTKPKLYNCIFAEKGGIFDRFCFKGIGYDNGLQLLRDKKNIRKYLDFLQKVAFSMFEIDNLILTKDEYQIPDLKFQGQKIKVIEFPIKPFFESDGNNIEFIHRSIYEYCVAEYIFEKINAVIDKSDEEIAGVFGYLLKLGILSNEILEYLKFKIRNGFANKFGCIFSSFQLMLQDGMTYYTEEHYYNVIDCEINIFANMLEILHLWDNEHLRFNSSISEYLRYSKETGLNLRAVDLAEVNLEDVYLVNADLREANLFRKKLKEANLREADLRNAYLREADLVETDLRGVDLRGADLTEVNLIETDLREADLRGADLRGIVLQNVIWKGAIFDERQIVYLIREYKFKELQEVKVYIKNTDKIMNGEKYIMYIIGKYNLL